MFSTRKSIINILALAFSYLLYVMRPVRCEMQNYPRLCEFLSQKAPRQYLKLCQNVDENTTAVRSKRDVNTTQQMFRTTTHKQPVTTSLPWYKKYECKEPQRNSNGFSITGNGLDLKVKCVKDENWWTAVVTWNKLKPEFERADCTGYVVRWSSKNIGLCDYIPDKNITSYIVDSSKGWQRELNEDERLFVAVFPLPENGHGGQITYRDFQPPACSGPSVITTLATLNSSRTTQKTKNTLLKNTGVSTNTSNSATPPTNHTKLGTQSGKLSNTSSGPVINKLVFSVVISCIAVFIVVIVFLIYKRRRALPLNDKRPNKIVNGVTHYISYNATNKNEAIDIALWLQDNNVNVIIDKFSLIIPNRRAWSEQQLLEAEKIIMIITKSYLDICTRPKSKSNQHKVVSYNDELVYNEISLIKNKLIDMETNKFIGILIDTKKKDLPHWMYELNCYYYKNGKLDEEILQVLKPCTNETKL